MADRWIPGARRDSRNWTPWQMDRSSSAVRLTWHTTENTQSARLDGIASYMYNKVGKGTGYTLLAHPSNGDLLQLRAANVGAGSLRTIKGYPSYNKTGTIHIQVSVCAYASERWWELYECSWFDAIINWGRSWGVSDQYVYRSSAGPRMTQGQWRSATRGHSFHRTVPNQTHTDPGHLPAPWSMAGGAGWIPPDAELGIWHPKAPYHRLLQVFTPMTRGEDVRWVQHYLASLNFDVGIQDGYFGEKTEAGVIAFQKSVNITADGIVGDVTASKMNMPGSSGYKPPRPAEPPPPSNSTTSIQVEGGGSVALRVLRKTSPLTSGRDVSSLQTLLNSHGHSVGKVDGQFGSRTDSGLRSFQAAKKLAVDGICGQNSWNRALNG